MTEPNWRSYAKKHGLELPEWDSPGLDKDNVCVVCRKHFYFQEKAA